MLGTLVRRERRPLWSSLILIIAIAIGGTLFAATTARTELTQQAETEAKLAAQTQLAPLLMPRDLMGPITGERAKELESLAKSEVLSPGPVTSIRLYSEMGRILYDVDPAVVTVKPTYVRDLVFHVANGRTQSEVRDGLLQTYVPIWLSPGGAVVVAEMSQPFDPIAAEARAPWTHLALALGIALAAMIALFALSLRETSTAPTMAMVQLHPAFRAAEDAREQAEQRATATEVAFKDLQAQFRTTLDQLTAAEAAVSERESQTTHSEDELGALRTQVRDTAERLHKAGIDNNALRERMALRQHELDDYKARLMASEERRPSDEIAELRRRVDVAERRATEMATEVERIEAELDSTSNRFHMVKLSEALREFENDDLVAEGDDDDLYEHPKVIFSARPMTAPGKVR
jgi:hypothetical protein